MLIHFIVDTIFVSGVRPTARNTKGISPTELLNSIFFILTNASKILSNAKYMVLLSYRQKTLKLLYHAVDVPYIVQIKRILYEAYALPVFQLWIKHSTMESQILAAPAKNAHK